MKHRMPVLIGLCVVAGLLLVLFGAWLGARLATGSPPVPPGASAYAAVYLTNGDVYFGKLDWSEPQPTLSDAWVLERSTTQQGAPQVNMAPFKNAPWNPIDEIYLNPQSVLFYTYLQSGSQLVKAFQP